MTRQFSVNVKGLQKRYGQRLVLDVDGLAFNSPHAYALIGANGSGKSTLLRILSGVIDATSGTIDVTGADRDSIRVGYMPQKSYVFDFSVSRNVALALEAAHLPKEEVEQRVSEALRAVGMDEMADARGSGLSGGEAQRVALARILVADLDVVLLDEPTASMDLEGTARVEQALAAYRERTGCLLIAATHAPAQARRISDHVVMLSSGTVVECGETDAVLDAPTSAEGRAFLSYWTV